MNPTRRKFIYLGVLGGSATFAGQRIWAAPGQTTSAFYQAAADQIRPLFEAKKPAQAGDWLADQKEPGQTFAQYLTTDPNRRTATLTKLYLQPIGHFTDIGIKHCTAYECCMNGSNNLAESDRAPLFFCAECDPKIWWACSIQPAERAKELSAVAKRFSIDAEASHRSRVAEILGNMAHQ